MIVENYDNDDGDDDNHIDDDNNDDNYDDDGEDVSTGRLYEFKWFI